MKELNAFQFKALWQKQIEKQKGVLDTSSLSKSDRGHDLSNFIVDNTTQSFLPFDFKVVWKDGSFEYIG